MLWNWLRHAIRFVVPTRKVAAVMGSRPGYLWEPARRRWVPENEATCMVYGAYTPIGPVYVPTGLHP